MTDLNRRELLTAMGLAAFAAACDVSRRGPGEPASGDAGADGSAADTRFFTAHEMATVTALADMVIPRDERSGSASDAGAPAYMDFALREVESETTRHNFRGGLAWLDTECRERYGRSFVECTATERGAVLDDIAWPERARADMQHGVVFFNRFRDLLATAFWASQMGVRDLKYEGNVARRSWEGCPPEALSRLGVSYS